MERLTFVCLHCQKSFRLAFSYHQHCPFCAATLYRVNHVPPKSKPKEWQALRRQIFRQETALSRELVTRSNALLSREYKLERQKGRKATRLLRKTERHRKKLNNSLQALES